MGPTDAYFVNRDGVSILKATQIGVSNQASSYIGHDLDKVGSDLWKFDPAVNNNEVTVVVAVANHLFIGLWSPTMKAEDNTGGVAVYDIVNNRTIAPKDGWKGIAVRDFAVEPSGRVWALNHEGLLFEAKGDGSKGPQLGVTAKPGSASGAVAGAVYDEHEDLFLGKSILNARFVDDNLVIVTSTSGVITRFAARNETLH
jgi:hypothetical protein